MENSQSDGNTKPPLETCMQDKKQQLELDMKQQTGSKLGKEYIKAVYCQLAYLTSMQSTWCKIPEWMKHKPESTCWGNLNNLRHADDTILIAENEEELEFFDEGEKGEWRSGLKTQHSKN